MKLNKKIIFIVIVLSLFSGLIIGNYLFKDSSLIKNETGQNSLADSKATLAIMIEQEDGTYKTSSSSSWPDDMDLNIEMSYCEDGSGYKIDAISYDTTTKKVTFTTTDRAFCKLYFEYPACRITAQNLIVNGSMEDTGWACPEYTSAYAYHGNYSCKITGTADKPEKVYANNTKIYLDNTHIYYSRVYVYIPTLVGTEGWQTYWPIAEPSMGSVIFNHSGSWKAYSLRKDRSSFESGEYPLRFDYDNRNNANVVYYDAGMLLDLTAIWGAGNEPTQAWVDANVEYIDTTGQIKYRISDSNPTCPS